MKELSSNRLGSLLVLWLTAMMMVFGCGKSADGLYTEAKKLIQDEKTLAQGIELLAGFEKNFPRDPRCPEVMLLLASSYQTLKQYDQAESIYQKLGIAHRATPEAEKGTFLLGYMLYEDIKESARAESVFTEFIKLYPESELVSSAKTLLENINLPIDEWPVVKNMQSSPGN
jgi:outer membrane protein assembly factor BamD (BamD/ComL family)